MGGSCSIKGRDEKRLQSFVLLKGKRGRKSDGVYLPGVINNGLQRGGFCGLDSEMSGTINGGTCIDQLSECTLVQDTVLGSYTCSYM